MSLRPPLHLKPRSDRQSASIAAISMSTGGAHVESNALLRGSREVLIRHGDEVYRLRHTRNDKLILTK
jgi:hemin uptake protein HemP